MAVWMSTTTGEQWDDGLTARTGEPGFTDQLATSHFGEDACNYVGTPNWQPPVAPDQDGGATHATP